LAVFACICYTFANFAVGIYVLSDCLDIQVQVCVFVNLWITGIINTIQYNTMKNLHSKTDKHTVSLI